MNPKNKGYHNDVKAIEITLVTKYREKNWSQREITFERY